MKNFFISLLSGKSDPSSKRFAAILVLLNIIAMAWVATVKDENKVTPEFMFDALALIAGSGLGLTVVEKVFGKKIGTPEVTVADETQIKENEKQEEPVVEENQNGQDPQNTPKI